MTRVYYEHSGIVIIHGDSLDVLATLDVDVLVTDPPYGVAYQSNWEGPFQGRTIANDETTDARDEVLALWGDGPAIVFGSWKMPPPMGAHTALVWDKGPASGMGNLSVPWKPSWETIFVLGSGFVGARDEGVLRGHTVVTTATMGRKHPNEKPVSLMRSLIAKCPPGVVCDPFCGSGSTLVAAKECGRRAIGIEVEERYCEIAARRLSQEVMCF